MGKNLIQQKRGRGSPRYRAPSFNYVAKASHRRFDKETLQGTILDLVHCPGHSAPLCLIKYTNSEKVYSIAPEGVKVGDFVHAGLNAPAGIGNSLPLKNIPEGTLIFNLENSPGDGGKICRASGTFAKVLAKSENSVRIMMPSRKERDFNPDCRAQIGIVAGGGRTEKPFMKAGSKWYAKKARNKLYPIVCGVSMNAVNHPFGGRSSHHKGKVTIAPKYAPPGRKAGKLRPRRTGMKR